MAAAPQRNKEVAHTHRCADTDQRGSAGASAEWLVEGGAAELQLLQVTVRNSDISRQGQALVEVLNHTWKEKLKQFCNIPALI